MNEQQTQELTDESALATQQEKPEEAYDWDDDSLDAEDVAETTEETPTDAAEETSSGEDTATDDDAGAGDDDLIAAAEQMGIKPEVAKQLPEEALRKLVGRAEEKPAEGKEEAETKEEDEEFELTFEDPDLAPEIVEKLKALNKHYSAKVKALNGNVKQLVGYIQAQERAAFEMRFDAWVEGLGDGFKPVLGEGRGYKMPRDSKEFRNRIKVLEKMDQLIAGSKVQNPDHEKIFHEAVNAVFGDRIRKQTEDKLAASVKKRQGQMLSRPTHRPTGTKRSAEAEAKEFVRDFMKSAGESTPGADDDEEVGI